MSSSGYSQSSHWCGRPEDSSIATSNSQKGVVKHFKSWWLCTTSLTSWPCSTPLTHPGKEAWKAFVKECPLRFIWTLLRSPTTSAHATSSHWDWYHTGLWHWATCHLPGPGWPSSAFTCRWDAMAWRVIDAARFRSCSTGARPHDPSCKLCGAAYEDTGHLIAHCSALSGVCASLLALASPQCHSPPPWPLLESRVHRDRAWHVLERLRNSRPFMWTSRNSSGQHAVIQTIRSYLGQFLTGGKKEKDPTTLCVP